MVRSRGSRLMTGEFHEGAERRTRPRALLHIDAELRTARTSFAVKTLDLSAHGVFVRTARPLPVGSRVQVSLRRGPQRNPLVLAAEVVRIGTPREGRAHGLGLRFTDVTAVDEASLRTLLAGPDSPSSSHDFML